MTEASIKDLRAQAEVLGLSKGGSKAELQARINEHLVDVADRAKRVTEGHYSTGKWAGYDNYKCNYCPFSSIKKRNIQLHIARVHPGSL